MPNKGLPNSYFPAGMPVPKCAVRVAIVATTPVAPWIHLESAIVIAGFTLIVLAIINV